MRCLLALMTDICTASSIYSVPYKSAREYVKRTVLTQDLAKMLDKPGRTVAVTGLGGAGKTQLVTKYAENNRNRYHAILWIDGHDENTIQSSFHRCAQALGLLKPNPRNEGSIHLVLYWLESQDKDQQEWLLIFDNVDQLNTGIADVIPSGSHGNIIITSRNMECTRLLPKDHGLLKLGDLSAAEAQSLLLSHLDLDLQSASEEIELVSAEICEALNNFALAIHLAGARIRTECASDPQLEDLGCSGNLTQARKHLERYSRDFVTHKDELLKGGTLKGLSSYDQTLWTVWDTTFAAIDEMPLVHSPKWLLILLAQLDVTFIPDKLFELAAKGHARAPRSFDKGMHDWLLALLTLDTTGEWDSFSYREAMEPLRRFSLVESSFLGVSIHPLVQWKALETFKHESKHPWESFRMDLMNCVAFHLGQSYFGYGRFIRSKVPYIPVSHVISLFIDKTTNDDLLLSEFYRGSSAWTNPNLGYG